MLPITAAKASVVRLPWDRGGVMEPHALRCAALALALSVELCSACASAADAGVPAVSLGVARLLGGVERRALPMGDVLAGMGLQRRRGLSSKSRTGSCAVDNPLILCIIHTSASADMPAASAGAVGSCEVGNGRTTLGLVSLLAERWQRHPCCRHAYTKSLNTPEMDLVCLNRIFQIFTEHSLWHNGLAHRPPSHSMISKL